MKFLYILSYYRFIEISNSEKKIKALIFKSDVTVQTGCYDSSLTAQSIHLREKSIAGPTERPKGFSLFGSQGSDQRFSMKMMFASYLRPRTACLNYYNRTLNRKGKTL